MLQRKRCRLVINRGRRKKHYVLINGFNRFMYDNLLHRERKHFCLYFLHAVITEEISKCHIKYCFKTNDKERIKMPKKGECLKFKNFVRRIKPLFMIYASFKSTLLPEIMESDIRMSLILTNIKNMLLVGYKLVRADDKFSNPFKFYIDEDSV